MAHCWQQSWTISVQDSCSVKFRTFHLSFPVFPFRITRKGATVEMPRGAPSTLWFAAHPFILIGWFVFTILLKLATSLRRLHHQPLTFDSSVSSRMPKLKIVSSDIMVEMQKKENHGVPCWHFSNILLVQGCLGCCFIESSFEEFDRKRQNQEKEMNWSTTRDWEWGWYGCLFGSFFNLLKAKKLHSISRTAPKALFMVCSQLNGVAYPAKTSLVAWHWNRSCIVLSRFLMSGPIRTVHRLVLCAGLLVALKAVLCMVQRYGSVLRRFFGRSLHVSRICGPSFESRQCPFLWLYLHFSLPRSIMSKTTNITMPVA